MKKCMYCKNKLSEEAVIEVCDRCGLGVWGANMFNTIKRNMQEAHEKGDI